MSTALHRLTKLTALLVILPVFTVGCVDRQGEDGLVLPNARAELSGSQEELWEIFDDPAQDTGYVHCSTYYNDVLTVIARKAGGSTADEVTLSLQDMPPLVSGEVVYTPDATNLHRIRAKIGTSYRYEAGCVQVSGSSACSHCTLDATALDDATPDEWIFVHVQCTDLWPMSGSNDYPTDANGPWPAVDLDFRVTCILSTDWG
ncbi:MAG: hypothetical protein ABI333_13330 [bacterium]